MATLVAIGYPDEATHVTPDKAIAALQQYGGTVIRTSLSDEDTKKLQEALQPATSVGADS